jgi:geranylgeranyl transferase type-2 subunit alpha
LLPMLADPSSDTARVAVKAELDLTELGLRENPKSYAAWHHRGWVVEHGTADLQEELKLVHK